MRLTQEQIVAINKVVARHAGKNAKIYLFGSKLDDSKKGGDVDLIVETETPLSLIDRAKIIMELEPLLMAPVDLISYVPEHDQMTPFQKIARSSAIPLERPA